MNKEELLERLESIQRKVESSKLADYALEDKVDLLETIFKLKERTGTEIKYLTEKLSDDRNYIDNTPILYNESRRFNLEDHLENCKNDEKLNNENIARYEDIVSKLEENLNFLNAENSKVIESLNEKMTEMSAVLRDSLDLSETELSELRSNYEYVRDLRDAHMDNIPETEKLLESSKAKLEEYKANVEGLKEATKQAEEMLSKFDKKEAEKSIIDEEAKEKDRIKLETYKANLKQYSETEKLVSYDYDKVIASIIDDYRNDKITSDEVIERMREYRKYIIEDFMDEDIQRTLENEEVEKNNTLIEKLEGQIADLEAKLSNDENYYLSAFIIEKDSRELSKLNTNIKKLSKQIDAYNEQNLKMQQEVETSDTLIEELEAEKKSLQKEIRRLGISITPEIEKEILLKIEGIEADIEYLGIVKVDSLHVIESNTKELIVLNDRQIRWQDIYDKRSSFLEKRNNIDLSAKRLDQQELAKLKDALAGLENRNKVVGVSLYEEIETLIKSNAKSTKRTVTPEEEEELRKFLDGIEDVTKENNDEKNNDSKENEEKDNVENNGITEEEYEALFQKGLDDGEHFEAKYLNNEIQNAKLAKKSKNKGFWKKLVKWCVWLVSLIGIVLGLKNCSNKQANDIIKNAQKNPSKYENLSPTEMEQLVKNELGVSEEETKKEEVVEEKVNEEKDDVVEETVKNEEEKSNDANYEENKAEESETINIELTEEEQRKILAEQGIIASEDQKAQTTIDSPVYDYDFNNPNAYGKFTEIQDGTPDYDNDSIVVKVNNGEKYVLNIGGQEYELPNNKDNSKDSSSFTELGDEVKINEDSNGALNLEINGDTAEAMKRNEALTLEALRKIREEYAAKYGGEVVTQEEVDKFNEDYQSNIRR